MGALLGKQYLPTLLLTLVSAFGVVMLTGIAHEQVRGVLAACSLAPRGSGFGVLGGCARPVVCWLLSMQSRGPGKEGHRGALPDMLERRP